MSKIVLIEDNAQSARLAAKLLQKAGHQVTTAETGEDGLTAILESPPDLVLIDLGLPDIDGQTVVALLRQQPTLEATRLIAFTAWPKETAFSMAQAYGCDGVITKPIDTRAFAAQVEAFIQPAPNPTTTDQSGTTETGK
jgi:DNA-binding response OmpR family regulator